MSEIHYIFESRTLRRLIRLGMSTAFVAMRVRWWLTKPQTRGASAFCFTPQGRLILVWSTYERGWNLPCGGLNAHEDPARAILRELQEEIGITTHGTIIPLGELHHRPHGKRDNEAMFHIADVTYRPKRSLEIERIGEFEPEALPVNISTELAERIARCGVALGIAPANTMANRLRG
jgi:8-oxo-dGTP pyrophosphatase MutT (NUDIX family)